MPVGSAGRCAPCGPRRGLTATCQLNAVGELCYSLLKNYRIRALLHAGKPNWDLLATITPR